MVRPNVCGHFTDLRGKKFSEYGLLLQPSNPYKSRPIAYFELILAHNDSWWLRTWYVKK